MTAPLPPVDASSAEWWEATRRSTLVVQGCSDCGHLQHPPRPVCLGCGAGRLTWREMSGRATVDAWTVVMRAPASHLDPPYTVARVRLEEGPLLLSRLTGDGHRCGQQVALEWEPLADGRQLPVFAPIEE